MGDCLRTAKLSWYITNLPGQLSLLSLRGEVSRVLACLPRVNARFTLRRSDQLAEIPWPNSINCLIGIVHEFSPTSTRPCTTPYDHSQLLHDFNPTTIQFSIRSSRPLHDWRTICSLLDQLNQLDLYIYSWPALANRQPCSNFFPLPILSLPISFSSLPFPPSPSSPRSGPLETS